MDTSQLLRPGYVAQRRKLGELVAAAEAMRSAIDDIDLMYFMSNSSIDDGLIPNIDEIGEHLRAARVLADTSIERLRRALHAVDAVRPNDTFIPLALRDKP